jgi:predicted nucleic acid-binding protein
VQIDRIDLLALLFSRVTIPAVVAKELRHSSAPWAVRGWMRQPPGWLKIRTAPDVDDVTLQSLDCAEKAALAARRGLVDLRAVLDQLKRTNFRYRQSMFDALLRQREGA